MLLERGPRGGAARLGPRVLARSGAPFVRRIGCAPIWAGPGGSIGHITGTAAGQLRLSRAGRSPRTAFAGPGRDGHEPRLLRLVGAKRLLAPAPGQGPCPSWSCPPPCPAWTRCWACHGVNPGQRGQAWLANQVRPGQLNVLHPARRGGRAGLPVTGAGELFRAFAGPAGRELCERLIDATAQEAAKGSPAGGRGDLGPSRGSGRGTWPGRLLTLVRRRRENAPFTAWPWAWARWLPRRSSPPAWPARPSAKPPWPAWA